MQPWSVLSRLAPWLLAVLLLGCLSHRTHLTESEQQSFGTRTFAAPYEATFAAARDALPALGYQLLFVGAAEGRITTARKQYGVRASLGLEGTSSAVLYRQYDLRLVRVDPSHTRVIAAPRLYDGERDVSSQAAWTMSGPSGEHEQWRALFAQIEAGLR
ncbi:hypothetical protein SAMN02745121_05667 [Nannocystis exedens]|uniref:Uncharacterized protein n=1 Tax=Nannocystis exedens TaxID=54 RepID=A0A1I2DPX7_9BACT|nr:hypothetical protein [Nannocystis exedens]PCC69000.1 hypothetical protein NAEX_02022 [Nannocystis exedens]SFE82489.1 hypothetical protein SAMN02745121_05667 [Nannocystis exedens]